MSLMHVTVSACEPPTMAIQLTTADEKYTLLVHTPRRHRRLDLVAAKGNFVRIIYGAEKPEDALLPPTPPGYTAVAEVTVPAAATAILGEYIRPLGDQRG